MLARGGSENDGTVVTKASCGEDSMLKILSFEAASDNGVKPHLFCVAPCVGCIAVAEKPAQLVQI